jgi:ABC-2 type transport system permease protein
MSGFSTLFKKEIKEQLRTHRLLVVAGIFIFFGLATPLLLKYLPQIIQLSGEQVPVAIPAPTSPQSLAEYAGTIGQLGLLMAVLVAMGMVANELRQGTAVMTLSKPVSRAAFVWAKLAAVSLTFLLALACASLFCFGYTVWLIGPAAALPFLQLNLLLALFLVFCLGVTLFFSSFFKSSLPAGGLAIGVLIAQALLGTVPRLGNFLPARLLTWGTDLVNGRESTYWGAVAVTAVLVLACGYLAQRILKNKEF